MTSEFEFLEGRLRNQLPELADAYGAPTVPTTGLESDSALAEPTAVMAGDFPLADELSPTDDNAVRHLETGRRIKQARISRIGLVTAVAGLVVVVGVLATAIGTRESVTSANPAVGQTDDQAETEVEQPKEELTVAVDPPTSNADADATTNGEAADQPNTSQPDELGVAASPVPGRGCVGNRVWEDLDGDGIQDLVEPGMVDTRISLLDEAGMRVDESGLINGYFSLCAPAGTYRLVVEIPEGYVVAAIDQGTSDHKDSDADPTGSINLTVDVGKKRTRYDIGLVPTTGEVSPTPTSSQTAAPTTPPPPTPTPTPSDAPSPQPTPTPTPGPSSEDSDDELAWGFWVETRNAYADNGNKPAADPGVETIFDNYSFAHVKAQSLASVNGDTTDRTYVVNVLRAAEQTNTVLDLQLGSSSEYGWNFSTGRGNFSLDRWFDAVSRFGPVDPVGHAAIQRAIDNGTIRYIFLIDEPNHKRWSPQWNGSTSASATGSSNYVTNQMLDQMAAHTKKIWGDNTRTIVRTAPTNLITASRGGLYRFEHMTHAYLTISSTKWMAGGRKGPNKGLEWFLTEKDNHTAGLTNFSAFNATNLDMSLMVQAGFRSSGNPWTGQSGFTSQWWQGSTQYPYQGQTSYVKTAPGEMDYWIKSMLSKRDPETGVLDSSGVRWIDDFSIFRADRIPTDAGRLPFSSYPHYRTFLDQLAADLDAGRLDPIIGIPVGWRGGAQ